MRISNQETRVEEVRESRGPAAPSRKPVDLASLLIVLTALPVFSGQSCELSQNGIEPNLTVLAESVCPGDPVVVRWRLRLPASEENCDCGPEGGRCSVSADCPGDDSACLDGRCFCPWQRCSKPDLIEAYLVFDGESHQITEAEGEMEFVATEAMAGRSVQITIGGEVADAHSDYHDDINLTTEIVHVSFHEGTLNFRQRCKIEGDGEIRKWFGEVGGPGNLPTDHAYASVQRIENPTPFRVKVGRTHLDLPGWPTSVQTTLEPYASTEVFNGLPIRGNWRIFNPLDCPGGGCPPETTCTPRGEDDDPTSLYVRLVVRYANLECTPESEAEDARFSTFGLDLTTRPDN